MNIKDIIITIAICILITYLGIGLIDFYVDYSEYTKLNNRLNTYAKRGLSTEILNSTNYLIPPKFCLFNCEPNAYFPTCKADCEKFVNSNFEGEHFLIDYFATSKGLCYCFYE